MVNKYILQQKNILAKQKFRGKLFYEKVCYHCGEAFVCTRQSVLACPENVCQVTVSRRLKAGKPLNKIQGIPEFPSSEIDFVKYGMECE